MFWRCLSGTMRRLEMFSGMYFFSGMSGGMYLKVVCLVVIKYIVVAVLDSMNTIIKRKDSLKTAAIACVTRGTTLLTTFSVISKLPRFIAMCTSGYSRLV